MIQFKQIKTTHQKSPMKKYKVTYKTKRPMFIFNMGSTTDARAAIIGNTHFKKEQGTFFDESPFIKFPVIPAAHITFLLLRTSPLLNVSLSPS